MKCRICGIEESLPFQCNYCDQYFCHIHRIPMNHFCPFLNRFTENRKLMRGGNNDNGYFSSGGKSIGLSLIRAIKVKSSKTEILHLFVATLVVTAVGLSLNGYRHISWQFLVIFISAFLVHEMAHKFLAQFYGSWAEFRAQVYGLLITAISAIPIIPFKFIAPGAVMVGLSDRNRFGKVALVGPLTNLVMGFSFLAAVHIFPHHSYLYSGATFNAWIAMFNLLPFGVLDGEKIFYWNKIVWTCTMAITMVLFVISHF